MSGWCSGSGGGGEDGGMPVEKVVVDMTELMSSDDSSRITNSRN